MIPHKLNSKLLFLALLGIILYFVSNVILTLTSNESMEEDIGAPAVSRVEAQQAALRFTEERLGLKGTETDIAYQTDKYASGYVAKNQLRKPYKEQFADKVPLDYWMVRVHITDRDTVTVNVGLDKPIVTGWSSGEPQETPHEDKWQTVAMKTLKDHGYNPEDWSYSPEESIYANTFVFISKTERLGDAPMILTVGVWDGVAVSLQPGFLVPDSFMDYIEPQEKLAGWMTGSSIALSAILGLTALILAIVNGRSVNWSRGIFLSLVVLILYILQNLNMADALLLVQGNNNGSIMQALMMVFVVVFAILTALSVWFSLLSGDQQWRRMGHNYWPRWRDPEFGEDVFYGMGRGYLICFFIMGAQQFLFMIAGQTFDSFIINDPSQSIYNMKWPWIFPTLAWVAAIMEEAVYRLFGGAIFKRMLRFNFLALLVPGIIWALGHTGYTIYPSYTRLIEVTVLAFIFGYTFLKYGLITAIFAHAILDSLLMSIALMVGDPTPTNIALGLFYIFLPVLIGYVIRYLHPRFGGPRRKPIEPLQPEPRLTP